MTTFAITTFPSLCAALGLLTFVWPSGLGVRGKAIWTMILLLDGPLVVRESTRV